MKINNIEGEKFFDRAQDNFDERKEPSRLVVNYWEKAAKYNNAEAICNLGRIFEGKDNKKSFEYYEKAALLGSDTGLSNLANNFYHGKGINNSEKISITLFSYLVDEGNPFACWKMGEYYCDGKYINKDYKKTIEYFKKGYERGDSWCTTDLGYLYYKGKGVEINYKKAEFYFREGALMGDASGYLYLGDMYKDGKGKIKEKNKAIEMYKKAEELGNKEATKLINKLLKK